MTQVHHKERRQKIVQIVFVTICAVLCLLPFIGMLWAPESETGETDLAEFPVLFEEGMLNTDYMGDLGDWFEDHFAYRSILVSVNAALRANLLGDSVTDEVIVGKNGWLYYAETLDDYTGSELLSERAIDNIVFNLSVMQGYVEAYGASFMVTIAPNKNSLYSENMPYYYLQGQTRNLTALEEALSAAGVNFVSMYDIFSAEEEVLYYQKDTHWNTKGALLATCSLLSAVGNVAASSELSGLEPVTVQTFIGDLNTMLYPASARGETDYSYDADLTWEFTAGESVEDSEVMTAGAGTGTLIMYRDSFANNMIPFLADVYETAYFTKMVPYDLTDVVNTGADTVIIERAERHLSDLGTDAVIMPAPAYGAAVDTESEVYPDAQQMAAYLSVGTDGDYIEVSGNLPDAYCSEDVQMYIGLQQADGTFTWYVPFHLSTDQGDYGFSAHFYASTYDGTTAVYLACTQGDDLICLGCIDAQ